MRARQSLTVAGLEFAGAAFQSLSRKITVIARVLDSDRAKPGDVLMEVSGPPGPF